MTPRSTTFGPGSAAGIPASVEGPRTALNVREGAPRHLEAHRLRLEAGLAALGNDGSWLVDAVAALADWLRGTGDAALRLAVHPEARFLVAALEPLPVPPSPCRLAPMPHPMGDLRSSPLARHKGLSGPWRTPARAEARQRGAEDALLLWPDGTLAETPIAAVALERGGNLILPPLEGRVDSLTERLDLPAWAASRGWIIHRTALTLADCDEGRVWCMNALRGFWPAELL